MWLGTLLCTCLSLLPYILIEYVNTTVWPLLFSEKLNYVEQKQGESINNNFGGVSDRVDNNNTINGISIIGSATDQRKQNGQSRKKSKTNVSYAFINPGYVADTTEDTRL